MMAKTCPVNFKMLDENQIRIQAILISLTALVFIFTGWVALAILLAYDFLVRLFISPKLSIFVHIALSVLKLFNIEKSPVDSAPKIFASQIGLVFSTAIVLSSLLGMSEVAIIIAVILSLCAGLEAFFNYCIGCKCYTVLHHFKIV